MSEERRTLHIDWVQAVAGALTAVSSAVLLSTVGVAGTLIGAAVGSVVATVGNAVYSHYLALSKERVAAKAVASVRAQHAAAQAARAGADVQLGGHRAEVERDQARQALREAQVDAAHAEEKSRVSWREAVSGLPWRRIAPVAAGVFMLAMVAILAFELVTGRAVSTYVDGGHARTSIPGLGGSTGPSRTPSDSPSTPTSGSSSPTSTPSSPPSAAVPPTTSTPSATPTPTPTPSATPTTPAPTPSQAPLSPDAATLSP